MTTPPPSDRTGARSTIGLVADPARVVGQLFVPGHALAGEREGRAARPVARVLGLREADATGRPSRGGEARFVGVVGDDTIDRC